MTRYEAMPGRTLAVIVLIDSCVKRLRDKLEVSFKDMSYTEVGGDIFSDIERRRFVSL